MNIGFLSSHNGSNFQAVVDACRSGKLQANPAVLISNNKDSGAISRAVREGIPHYHLSQKTHPDPVKLDLAILDAMIKHNVEIIVLAGYMKKLGTETLSRYRGRILNIHPALLPKFGGKGMYGMAVHEAVIAAGEKQTGVTIHIADENYDTGPIISQAYILILPEDSPETLSKRVLELEHSLLPETLQKIAEGKIKLPLSA